MRIGLQVAGFLWTCKHDQVYACVFARKAVQAMRVQCIVCCVQCIICCVLFVLCAVLSQYSVLICV